MNRTLETVYHGIRLTLEIGAAPSVTLRINGLVRDRATGAVDTTTLRVSSTVQTDYEWHEFIEGIVRYDGGRIHARIIANNLPLTEQDYGSTVTP